MPLIAFSGIDGTGKSTQISLLEQHLSQQGRTVNVLWYRPGYGAPANAARRAARRLRPSAVPVRSEHPKEYDAHMGRRRVQVLWCVMALVDMTISYGLGVRWRSRGKRIVLVDRWTDDALIDFDMRFPALRVRRWPLARLVIRLCPRPGVQVLLVGDEDELQRRLVLKDEPFPDNAAIRPRRRAAYDALANSSTALLLVDATEATLDVHRSILSLTEPAFERSR